MRDEIFHTDHSFQCKSLYIDRCETNVEIIETKKGKKRNEPNGRRKKALPVLRIFWRLNEK